MIESFWEKVGENIATEWSSKTLSLAFAFWGLGLLTYSLRVGWESVTSKFILLGQNAVISGFLLIFFLIIIVVSNLLIGWLVLPVLRFLEGYWPFSIREKASVNQMKKRSQLKTKLNNLLVEKEGNNISMGQERELARLEYTLQYYFPANEGLILPTPIGNIIKSAEEYPLRVYGLDVTITWPHIWLVMPDYSRKQVLEARQVLNERVSQFIWCLLILVWTLFQWWIPILVFVAALLCLYSVKVSAFTYAQLLKAVYDIHRFDLYENLHWQLPICSDTEDEVRIGKSLTSFIYRHQVDKPYIHSKEH